MASDPYENVHLYDLEYSPQTNDISYYLELARKHAGEILELGCGNGRISLPLAEAGHRVHGLDCSPAMLRDLETKLRGKPDRVRLRLQYQLGDFRDFDFGRKYTLVFLPFNAFHHNRNHADVLNMLTCIRNALAPGGVFAMDCYLPDITLYQRPQGQRYDEMSLQDEQRGLLLESWEEGYYDPDTRIHHVIYVYQSPDGAQERVHLQLHMFEQSELRTLFRSAGFEIIHEYGEFDRRPIQKNSLKWVLVMRPISA